MIEAQVEVEAAALKKSAEKSKLPLLLEVGCEEIPARFLSDARRGLGERVRTALEESRLLPAPAARLATYSTPRRLVVHAPAMLAQQPDKVEEVLGPPVKVAIDATGKYTRAAESFAQKNAARLDDLKRTHTPKGEYLALTRTTPGRPASEVLAEILPNAILGLSFPKSMYWTEKSAPRFVRPIRWVVAILGEGKNAATVGFEVLGVKSGNFTFGHRTKGSKPILVTGFNNYYRKLLQALVEVDDNCRLGRVLEESQKLVEGRGLKTLPDAWLADWIVNATEWPHPMLGDFDARFLHLPREILITVMRDHQRYFAVEKATPGTDSGQEAEAPMAPHFVAVLNTDSDERGLIRQGHERVLTARFRDAEFFWNADQKRPLRERVALLAKVTYQAKLGSYGDKVRRMGEIAGKICDTLEPQGFLGAGERQHAMRAVELAKCDLTTQMVQEFTELQGVVGGLYARAQGEPPEVADAIYDHYLPLGVEGASPRTLAGALVSLADKIDSVVAGFSIGNEPTGSSDPFALRRQANGIIKVLVDFRLPITFNELVLQALKALCLTREGMLGRVVAFLAERLTFYLESVGRCRYDTARAVMAAQYENAADALGRAQALEKVRDSADFAALAAAAKRTRNILRKSAAPEEYERGTLDRGLLAEEAEVELYRAYESAFSAEGDAGVEGAGGARDYAAMLTLTARLRPPIDKFFDKVLVMHSDPTIRKNRLLLLRLLETKVFSRVADLSEIEGHVDAST